MRETKPTIYLETSVISAYFGFKDQDPIRKDITVKFFEFIHDKFDLFISETVVSELSEE